MNIGSYSVDCPQVSGQYDPGYTTILASSMSTRIPPSSTQSMSTPSLPVILSPSSQQSSASAIPSQFLSSSTIPSLLQDQVMLSQDIRSSPSSNSQPSSSPSSSPPSSDSRLLWSPSSSSSSSPTSSTPSSQSQNRSGNDGGLSGPSTIAIGVVVPGVGVIVAIVFGVLDIKRWKR